MKSERESWRVFGNYLHTYYYDKSVQDGYTLKIIREDIETAYREKLEEVYQSIENLVQKKDVKKEDIVEHPNYVKELLRYIIGDLKRSTIAMIRKPVKVLLPISKITLRLIFLSYSICF